MEIPGLLIRQEAPREYRQTEELVREAFFNRYAPGAIEHHVLYLLRKAPGFLPWHSLVAEYRGKLIGQAMLSPARVVDEGQAEGQLLCLGPICVLPAAFHRGIGKQLMQAAIETAREHQQRAILLLGDPGYYSRFGFVPAASLGIHLPGKEKQDPADYFMALPLAEGALKGVKGIFHEDPAFSAASQGLDAFDASFPKREKLVLPGQLG